LSASTCPAEVWIRVISEQNRSLKKTAYEGSYFSEVRDAIVAHPYQRRSFANWRRIGRLTLNEAIASYNGDFVLHFTHPTWRDDRNDPATATRVNERKVR
jgi:hypothetical protein